MDPAVPPDKLVAAKVFDVPVAAVAMPFPVVPLTSAVKTTLVAVAAAEAEVFLRVGDP